MGEVYRSICQSSQHPNQVERISGRIAIALLSESKDKVSLPFAAFAETVVFLRTRMGLCPNVGPQGEHNWFLSSCSWPCDPADLESRTNVLRRLAGKTSYRDTTQSCEGEYISAGNRLLSAACLPQPKLTIHYTAVNSSQEQVFRLEVSSARRWLRHNHLWASEMWTNRHKCLNPN
ncbi:hypothetical protein XENOCAPTIV_007304 [Xenoophorus captivus]|uniref:Protein TOPAZ1 n=1 Tax=Xenoophorus captivus TaxID=1517983 RepID=A0ABV0R001_9TELE